MTQGKYCYKTIRLLIAAILIVGAVACKSRETEPGTAAEKNLDIEKVKLSDLDGNQVDLREYHDRTVFINFWATWCKPCLHEMPSIARAQELLANEDVVFLLASDESSEQISEFRNYQDFKFTYVRIENAPELNIIGLPTTFIYSPEGKLVFSEMGLRKWDEEQNLQLILDAKYLK